MAQTLHTDKNTAHSYLCPYEVLFWKHQKTAKNVLEIGVDRGGSLTLWSQYFENAHIHGIDQLSPLLPSDPRIHLYIQDAYASSPVLPKMDVIIEDGSHRKEDMMKAIELYLPLLNDGGIFVVEDIPDIEWVDDLRKCVPEGYECQHFDWRLNKGRHDDIVLVIWK